MKGVKQAWKQVDERAKNVRESLNPDLARRVMTIRADKACQEAERCREKAESAAKHGEDIVMHWESEMRQWARADRWSQHLSGVFRPLYTAPGMTRMYGRESTQHADG